MQVLAAVAADQDQPAVIIIRGSAVLVAAELALQLLDLLYQEQAVAVLVEVLLEAPEAPTEVLADLLIQVVQAH